MNRRELSHIAILAVAGLAIRLALFMDVGVNGDSGLYLYDAKQILWGRRLFIDIPSRSPVYEYMLAAVIAPDWSPIIAARSLMVLVSVTLSVAIYAFTRRLHGHRGGLAAMALFNFTILPTVWGIWVKTEQVAALFVLAALLVTLRVIDRETIPLWAASAVGVLFGLAFLTRRVAFVHFGAFGLFVVWYRFREVGEWRLTIKAGVAMGGAGLLTLLVVYAALGGFDPGLTGAVADSHAMALFSSDGQGSIGWTEDLPPKAVTAEDRGSLLASVCQKCGRNTVIIFIATVMITLPALLPLLVFLRSFLEPAGFVGEVAMPVAFVVAGITALLQLVGTPYWTRALGIGIILAAVGIAWLTERVPWERVYRPELALPAVILVALAAGYLYRDRILYVTYFQDLYPFVVTLAGISAVEFYDTVKVRRRQVLSAVVVLLLLSTLVSAGNAYPYRPHNGEGERSWHSIELVQAYGDDINNRVDPGERVLTAQPLYVIESDRKIVAHLSRKYYLFEGWPDSAAANQTEREIVGELGTERVPYVIYGSELQTVYNNSDAIEPAVEEHYRPVSVDIYDIMGATLLERQK